MFVDHGGLRNPIYRVDVEFLRRGERGNHLLSKNTDYLSVCGPERSGVVHVPRQHGEMLRVLEELRYQVGRAEPEELHQIRSELGADLACMLGSVPGLSGQLERDDDTMVHLRLTMSASELALLPFEMCKVPIDGAHAGTDWLLPRPGAPVALSRHVRGVPKSTLSPSIQPRILFVAGNDVPFDEHLNELLDILRPWHGVYGEHVQYFGEQERPYHLRTPWLTVLRDTDLASIREATAADYYTHVHVLAHGIPIDARHHVERYGIELQGRPVSGEDLVLALSTSASYPSNLPQSVTLAACDSAAPESMTAAAGSVAFELHAAGVPLVVASQFPISEDASVPFVSHFYRGQLNGQHPLKSVSGLRRELKTEFPDEHAWASLVVYESLPHDLRDHLDEVDYWQSRRARDRALDDLRIAHTTGTEASEYAARVDDVLASLDALPISGMYESEGWGLQASAFKVLAETAFARAVAADDDTIAEEALDSCFAWLERAEEAYEQAAKPVLQSSRPEAQRMANIHWLVGQIVALQAVLGRKLDRDALGAVRYSALHDLDNPDQRTQAWAHVSMLEMALLELSAAADDQEQAACIERVLGHASRVVALAGCGSEPASQTVLQLRRYQKWWTNDEFRRALERHDRYRSPAWAATGLLATVAGQVIQVLTEDDETDSFAAGHGATARVMHPPQIPRVESTIDTASEQRAPTKTGHVQVELVPAGNGDCLWLSYGADGLDHHVMIDCGAVAAAPLARERILSVDEVELFVMTHIDADHISGAIPLLTDTDVLNRVREVWFNGRPQLRGFLSVNQGEKFTELLDTPNRSFLWNGTNGSETPPAILVEGVPPEIQLPGGLRLTILSPNRRGLRRLARHWNAALPDDDERKMLGRRGRPEPIADPSTFDVAACALDGPTKDTSVPNLSSIAFLAEFGGRTLLLTGDAHADVLAESLRALQQARGRAGERIKIDAMKLSHHGSATATTAELLELVDCQHYLVPTNGSVFYHPDRQAIARVISNTVGDAAFYFSHRSEFNELWADDSLQQIHGHSAHFPTDEKSSLTITL